MPLDGPTQIIEKIRDKKHVTILLNKITLVKIIIYQMERFLELLLINSCADSCLAEYATLFGMCINTCMTHR